MWGNREGPDGLPSGVEVGGFTEKYLHDRSFQQLEEGGKGVTTREREECLTWSRRMRVLESGSLKPSLREPGPNYRTQSRGQSRSLSPK